MDPAISESDNKVTIERSAEALMCNGHGESHPQEDSNKNSSGQECCESNHVGGEGNPMEEGSTTDDGNQRRSQSPGVHSSSPSEKSNSSGQYISLSLPPSPSLSLSLSLSTRKWKKQLLRSVHLSFSSSLHPQMKSSLSPPLSFPPQIKRASSLGQ